LGKSSGKFTIQNEFILAKQILLLGVNWAMIVELLSRILTLLALPNKVVLLEIACKNKELLKFHPSGIKNASN
jgi:hypothetical protein